MKNLNLKNLLVVSGLVAIVSCTGTASAPAGSTANATITTYKNAVEALIGADTDAAEGTLRATAELEAAFVALQGDEFAELFDLSKANNALTTANQASKLMQDGADAADVIAYSYDGTDYTVVNGTDSVATLRTIANAAWDAADTTTDKDATKDAIQNFIDGVIGTLHYAINATATTNIAAPTAGNAIFDLYTAGQALKKAKAGVTSSLNTTYETQKTAIAAAIAD